MTAETKLHSVDGSKPDYDLEILLPVHNEAISIRRMVEELYLHISRSVNLRLIICEDGSRDNTKEVLRGLAHTIPGRMLLSEERKGCSRAVKDGMHCVTTPYVLCLDSDGQCDPADFNKIWSARHNADIVIGWRVKRADNPVRKTVSRLFYLLYRILFRIPIHDPSCPYVLIPKRVVEHLVDEMGEMQQGFWWEFAARAHRRGYTFREIPISHRERSGGVTQVYRLNRLPAIAYSHVLALFKIWAQTRS
jgi:dolichol-phosphate mannosyltransferase